MIYRYEIDGKPWLAIVRPMTSRERDAYIQERSPDWRLPREGEEDCP